MLRLPKRKRTRIAIHLTALIDMVFLLLIYFLLTSSFVEQEGIPISVPRVTESSLYGEGTVMVVIDQAGRFYLDRMPLPDRELAHHLAVHLALSSGKGVVIKADRRVAYDRVVQALDIAKASGARQLNLTVEKLSP